MPTRQIKAGGIALLLTAPLALGGCVIAVSEDGFDSDFDHQHRADFDHGAGTVFGAHILADTVTFRVTSNGCTDEESFLVDVDRHGEGRYSVAIERTEPDRCRALVQDGVEVSWAFADLGISPGADVRIENQVRRR